MTAVNYVLPVQTSIKGLTLTIEHAEYSDGTRPDTTVTFAMNGRRIVTESIYNYGDEYSGRALADEVSRALYHQPITEQIPAASEPEA